MILCLGTTPAVQRVMVFDHYVPGEVNRASQVLECLAGKSGNAAKAARALGASVTALTFVGGRTGELYRQGLDAAGIAHDLVEVDHPTRLCITVVDRSKNDATELVEETAPVSPAALSELRRRFAAIIPQAKVLVLSGTLAPGVPVDFYAECTREANRHGVAVIVDAHGEPLRQALPARPLVVKPNRAELGRTVGHPVDTPAALRDAIGQLAGESGGWVLVTSGPGEVLLGNGRDLWRIDVPTIRPVSAIGSGDSLAGGLAVALLNGETFPEAATLGIACGISNALHILPGQIDRQQVDELREKLRILNEPRP